MKKPGEMNFKLLVLKSILLKQICKNVLKKSNKGICLISIKTQCNKIIIKRDNVTRAGSQTIGAEESPNR